MYALRRCSITEKTQNKLPKAVFKLTQDFVLDHFGEEKHFLL